MPWKLSVDTGGTFTDCIATDTDGRVHRSKVLSSSALRGVVKRATGRSVEIEESWDAPDDFVRGFTFRVLGDAGRSATGVERYDSRTHLLELDAAPTRPIPAGSPFEVASPDEAPVLAARLVTGTPAGRSLPDCALRLATTRGTNALLERQGARAALFITEGFGDLTRIGTQERPDLFALDVRKPAPLFEEVVEVPERVAVDGTVLRGLDLDALAEPIERLRQRGIETAAVALLGSYRFPTHEQRLAERLRRSGFKSISVSSELAPFIKLLPRAQTTIVDAYLAPIIGRYLENVSRAVDGERIHVMTSAGGLVDHQAYCAKDSLLSGPAGGVAGAAHVGRKAGYERVLSFDMGGTSTDVARYDGDYEYVFEHRIGDAHLVAPALAIESVAAGGGSICTFDGHRLRVGPESARAFPGPACYGAGGPLAVTDVNLLLGRLVPERFKIPVRREAAEARLGALIDEIERATGERAERGVLLEGLVDIANERMADAIRSVSLRRGYDPADHALVAFGGAGGQHACGVADRLGVRAVLVPADAGLLSAVGIQNAVIERFAEEQVLAPLEDVEKDLVALLDRLGEKALGELAVQGVDTGGASIRRRIAHLRFSGQDTTLSIEYTPGVSLRDAFARAHEETYGHRVEGRSIEVESVCVVASSIAAEADSALAPTAAIGVDPHDRITAQFRGRHLTTRLFDRARLPSGARIDGPAIVADDFSTTVIEPGWSARVDQDATLVMTRSSARVSADSASRHDSASEAVRLELFTNRFRAIAREMGDVLERTALSTNVKERLDFSCALLDAEGELVVNAPHIPVHLGALGLCVRKLRESVEMEAGDVVATNHPAYGGSHLPDITVVTPVFSSNAANGELLGYVASRAHHAEIGGVRPGSMPPTATRLVEEGVVLAPTYLVKSGKPGWDAVRKLFEAGPHPTRSIEDNLADLRAAVAANHRGAGALRELARSHGVETVTHYMDALKANAERHVRAVLGRLTIEDLSAEELLDDGTRLRVLVSPGPEGTVIDFTGSGPVHRGNLNVTPAIVQSAVMYVLRLLLDEPLPLNDGLLRAVTLRLPPDSIVNPRFPEDPAQAPAVVGGNVETSQRIVDTLLKCFERVACSQGTMNNVLFGTERFGYYETVCGGTGAGPGFDGTSAVHSHMTNTRITDPEILEHRYPVRVERFAIRQGSGGEGRWRGGDGVVRELVFLEAMSLSILAQHRHEGPYGMEGGSAGEPGKQMIVRADGAVMELKGIDGCEVRRGDRLILETPGGGGWGATD